MRQTTGKLLVILAVTALLAGTARAGEKGGLPDDLKLVSGKGGGFVSLRVADLLKSATAKTLFQKMALMEPKVEIEKEMARELGIAPAQVERITVLLPESLLSEPVIAFRSTQTLDREKMFANLRNRPQKKEHQGRTYYGHQFGGSFYFVSDRVFVASSERALTAWLDNDPAKVDPGAYRPALLQAAQGTPVVAAVGQPLLNKAAQALPEELSAPLTAAKTALLTVLGEKDTQFDLRLTLADDKAAATAAGTLKGTIGFSREQIPVLRGQMNQVNNVQGFQVPEVVRWILGQADEILQQTDKALNDAMVSAEGTTVTARTRSQTSAERYILLVGMGGVAVGGQAQAVPPPPPPPPKKEEKKK
jgi:hypothetical protein